MRSWERTVLVFVAVASLAGGAARAGTAQPAGPVAPVAAGDLASELTRLKGEIEGLKGLVPDQSHVMKDIAYHFSKPVVRGTGAELAARGLLPGRDSLAPQMGGADPSRAPDDER